MSVSEEMVLTWNRENRFHGTATRVECLLREIFGRRKDEMIEMDGVMRSLSSGYVDS